MFSSGQEGKEDKNGEGKNGGKISQFTTGGIIAHLDEKFHGIFF
jgi:hypothetical protein